LGSIQLTPSISEIDYVPNDFRLVVGDIFLTSAIIQHQLAELFAKITGINSAIFVYLGHTLDTSQTIKALQRLVKSDDAPVETSSTLSDSLKRCIKVLEERNKIAHNPLIYVDSMFMRSEVRGGPKPHRVMQVLQLSYFTNLLQEMKCVLWELRSEVGALQRRESKPSS
jgi:hypothetical protein